MFSLESYSLWMGGHLLCRSPHTHWLNNNRSIQILRPCVQSSKTELLIVANGKHS